MTDEKKTEKKVEVNYHANPEASALIPNDQRVQTNIGACRGAKEKYEIYFWKPLFTEAMLEACAELNEATKKRYDCDLNGVSTAAVGKWTTSPDYPSVMFEVLGETKAGKPIYVNDEFPNGKLKPGGHAAGQALADGFQVGRKSGGPTQKAEAAEMRSLKAAASEYDLDIQKVIADAIAKKAKAKK